MKNLWITLLLISCIVTEPLYSQLYNNNALITISSGTTLSVQSDPASTVGFFNQGTVQNNGQILLGIVSDAGEIGIQNSGIFANNNCAEIFMLAPLSNSSTFNNNGLFSINTSVPHVNSGLLNNGIIVNQQDNPIPNVTNNEIVLAPTTSSNCVAISPAFDLGDPIDFTVLGIFTDEMATLSAGTYDLVTNTFIPTVPNEAGTYDYFVAIQDESGDCTRIVPWQLMVEVCCEAPEAICSMYTAVLVGSSVTISAEDIDDGSTSDCGLQSMVVVPNTFNCSHVGTPQIVTLTVTDINGHSSSCTTTITVTDDTPPTFPCPANQDVDLNINCQLTVPDLTSSLMGMDNCDLITITQNPKVGTQLSLAHNDTIHVTIRAMDGNGNSSDCTVILTGKDETPPSVACFAQTISFNGDTSIVLDPEDLVEATDNCGVSGITLSPSSISIDQIGQIFPVLVTVTDMGGNTASCTSQITATGLPEGWSQDINGVGCNDGNDIDFDSGSEIWTVTSTNCYYTSPFTSDALAFAQRTLCGNGSITAEITSINGTSLGWAGVVMRETNNPGAKKAQITTNMSYFSRREFRVLTGGTAFPQQFPSLSRYWLRLVRSGNQFIMYVSSNGVNWIFAGANNIQMNDCIEAGLVVTNYSLNSTVTATFASVSVFGTNSISLANPRDESSLVNTNDIQAAGDFKVFPNPTSGELNVALSNYAGRSVSLEVHNTMGKLLFRRELDELHNSEEVIDLSAFPNGMYLIQINSEGIPSKMKRVILSR